MHEFLPTSPILIRIKILAACHLFCLFCCLFLWVICCPPVIICPTVTDKKNHTGGRETRPKLNMKTAGQAAAWRPWKVGLYKALQKPWETLSQYIKDTVCSSSLLLFLLPSSPSLSPDYSLFIFLPRLFSLFYTSAVCFFIHSFLLFLLKVTQPSFSLKPTVLTLKAESAIKCW